MWASCQCHMSVSYCGAAASKLEPRKYGLPPWLVQLPPQSESPSHEPTSEQSTDEPAAGSDRVKPTASPRIATGPSVYLGICP